MTEPTCGCGRPSPDSTLCTACMAKLEADLAALPEALGELTTTLARQARIGGGKRGKGDAIPAPIDLGALKTGDAIRNTLTSWVRTILEDAGPDTHGDQFCVRPHTRDHHIAHEASRLWRQTPQDDLPDMARWLLGHLRWARHSLEAPLFADEIHQTRRAIERAIDRPEQRLYAGPCATGPCEAQLYARPGKDRIVCDGWAQDGIDGCGAVHSAAERKAWLRDTIEDHLAPLQVILDALPVLMVTGREVGPATIRQWRRARGEAKARLLPHGIDRNGVELYRGGDVIDLVLDQAARTGPKRKDLTEGRISA